jgi:hypothetical protein
MLSGGNMTLAGSTPNGFGGYQVGGYAIYLDGAILNSGGTLTMEGSATASANVTGGVSMFNVASPDPGSAANGGNQSGIYLGAPVAPIIYNSGTT